jgi:hypothetical protein
VLIPVAAQAQNWQQKWSGRWLTGTCYRFPPPHEKTIGAEAQYMLHYDAKHFVTQQNIQTQELWLRCMKAAGAPE